MSGHVFAEHAGKLHFVGDFDGLYAEEPDPWSQSGEQGPMAAYYRHSRSALADVLHRRSAGQGRGLEIGCGHGHLTAFLQGRLGERMTGMDVSHAAALRAQELHAGPRFVVGDITSADFEPPGKFSFVLWAQCLWYVLHRIETAVENSLSCVAPGGLFVVSQAFLAEQKYGRDVADGFHGALRLFSERFGERLSLVEARYDDSGRFEHRDGLLAFRAK